MEANVTCYLDCSLSWEQSCFKTDGRCNKTSRESPGQEREQQAGTALRAEAYH